MIANQCFTKEWVARKKQEMGSVDPDLLEKSIHALALLCGLGESSIPFVFKGGTSMILLKISRHLVNTRFRLEEAKISASRAVLLAALLKTQSKEYAFNKFRWNPKQTSGLASLVLKPPLDKLNRIKALIPEAFYNLYTTQELLK
jgi:hypothetical protein